VLVCKVDRLTRSLADFAKLIDCKAPGYSAYFFSYRQCCGAQGA